MQKPAKYDETEVREYGDYKALPLGGYKMVIAKAYEGETTTFRPTLNLELDVAVGDYKWYFSEIYQNDNQANKKWPRGGTYSVITEDDEKTLPFLKGLITSIERSNPGFTFNWNDTSENQMKSLEGKLVGAIYGLEEYKDSENKLKTARKIRYIRSIDSVENALIPDVKMLNGSYMSYDDYEELKECATESNNPTRQAAEETSKKLDI